MFFSIIIPVYNRPQEIKALLESLVLQDYRNFEVIVVEDGSVFTCDDCIASFKEHLDIHYFFIKNVGQGFARNYGMERAKGEYFVLFDSDCIIPPGYLKALKKAITERKLDAHGGPDAADSDFSSFQKAVNYSMTSILTTGGIRGKMKNPSKYQARGYNMGLSRTAFEKVGGFIDANRAEDIELSLRLKKAGFHLELVEEAYVYHRRRNSWKSLLDQSYSFGQNRVHVSRFHPEALQFIHLMPFFFLGGWILAFFFFLISFPFYKWIMGLYGIWLMLVFLDASRQEKSIQVGLLSIFTSFAQLSAYGLGLISALWKKAFQIKPFVQ